MTSEVIRTCSNCSYWEVAHGAVVWADRRCPECQGEWLVPGAPTAPDHVAVAGRALVQCGDSADPRRIVRL